MASVQKSVTIACDAVQAWDAVSDVGKIHTRLAPTIVADTRLKSGGEVRVVTFANGIVLKEQIISNSAELKRLVWSAESEHWHHHNASLQVHSSGPGECTATWTADVLPHAAGAMMEQFLEMGLSAMKAHLESQ